MNGFNEWLYYLPYCKYILCSIVCAPMTEQFWCHALPLNVHMKYRSNPVCLNKTTVMCERFSDTYKLIHLPLHTFSIVAVGSSPIQIV